uniref:Uncharacterized protein n=1 Tax=Romanomermis culicivorax TaxID=13658 RepID=A0A915KXZ3_ROMCU
PNLAFDLPREFAHYLALDSAHQLPIDSSCDLPQTSARHFPHDLARHLPHGFMSPFSTTVVYCLARESPHHEINVVAAECSLIIVTLCGIPFMVPLIRLVQYMQLDATQYQAHLKMNRV